MTKTELTAKLAQDMGISKKQASATIDATLASIKDAVRNGETVSFIGFGSFKMVERAAREGRDPRSGKTLKIPAKKTVKFSAGKTFKEMLNDGKGKKKK